MVPNNQMQGVGNYLPPQNYNRPSEGGEAVEGAAAIHPNQMQRNLSAFSSSSDDLKKSGETAGQ